MGQLVHLRSGILLVPEGADKDRRHRIGKYNEWLVSTGHDWNRPALADYRDYMLNEEYEPSTVQSHLSTIRSHYVKLLRDRPLLFSFAARYAGPSFHDQKDYVDELVKRIENAIDPESAPVTVKTSQDVPDSRQVRLTSEQANALLAAPGVDSLMALRDTAVIATLLCTGIREAELAALEVRDLRQRFDGELALNVREGKGCKERMVLYGELSWVVVLLTHWLKSVNIPGGPVFRGFYKGGKRLRRGALSVRAVGYIVSAYPVPIDGRLATVTPHDLRRTYARRMYDAGMSVEAIQRNLGHADVKTTQGYIGPLGAKQRRARAVYSFDLGRLKKAN